jgi:23S rRNA pseudouridine2605 synthase
MGKARRKEESKSKKRPKKVAGRRRPARTSSAREAKSDVALLRLNKYLADHGVASRRGCDVLIADGKVMVDDLPVTELGTKIDPTQQKVEVNGHVLRPGKVYTHTTVHRFLTKK